MQIRRGGKLLWWEQGVLAAGGALMASPLGLAGHTVCATLIAVGTPVSPAVLAALREIAVPAGAVFGATQMKSLVVVRLLCGDSEAARRDHAGRLAAAAPRHAGTRRRRAPHLEHLIRKEAQGKPWT